MDDFKFSIRIRPDKAEVRRDALKAVEASSQRSRDSIERVFLSREGYLQNAIDYVTEVLVMSVLIFSPLGPYESLSSFHHSECRAHSS